MATVTNPTTWSLFSKALGRSLDAGEIVELDDAQADEVCASGVFVRLEEPEEAEAPIRRARSQRGSQVVEEAIEADRETR